ncbi:MAG: DUF1761 domain-containing protein [Candidatus Magasanikbacteria bacterium]|nr:DUF1761 domain-containing protein [Candidatus Magasanikbacteria bacterium]
MEVPINYLAVLVSALANMVLGFLWFGPVFGKVWMKTSGMTAEKLEESKKKGMAVSYVLMVIGSLLMAYVLAHALIFGNAYLGTSGWSSGVMVGFWNWLGFVLPVTIGVVLWDGKPWKFWAVTYLYNLVGFMLMGIILAIW